MPTALLAIAECAAKGYARFHTIPQDLSLTKLGYSFPKDFLISISAYGLRVGTENSRMGVTCRVRSTGRFNRCSSNRCDRST